MRPLPILAALCLLLAGCGERDQAKTAGNANRGDAPFWRGAHNPYVAQGWQPGTPGSWENQIRSRGQQQNEYMKAN